MFVSFMGVGGVGTEEVYMLPPPGFIPQGEKGKVCRLKKAIYGLKQSID